MAWLPNLLTASRLVLLLPIMLLPATWLALGLALVTAYWSMFTLFWKNADLWRRPVLEMERRPGD